jgi:hypothetical protein
MDITKKVPLFVIFIVIIFILVFVVILSSLGSSEKTVEKVIPKLKTKPEKKITFSDINLSSVSITKESDSLCFEFDDLCHDITYIFGSQFDNSVISIYKESLSIEYELFYTNIYSGNYGFVLSSNPYNVNASYFQLGTKLDLQNIKYKCIYLEQNAKYKVVVNNVVDSLYKVNRFTINYNIRKSQVPLLYNSKPLEFGLSEYDLEHKIKKDYPDIKERISLTRLEYKKWEFSKPGKYLIAFLTNKYNFTIKDKSAGKEWNSVIKSESYPKIHYEIIENPNLVITNLDENINPKSFNSDFVQFVNTPFTLYDHFLHGPKKKKVDIINRISNKILIYML